MEKKNPAKEGRWQAHPYVEWSLSDRLRMLAFEAELAHLPRSLISAIRIRSGPTMLVLNLDANSSTWSSRSRTLRDQEGQQVPLYEDPSASTVPPYRLNQ